MKNLFSAIIIFTLMSSSIAYSEDKNGGGIIEKPDASKEVSIIGLTLGKSLAEAGVEACPSYDFEQPKTCWTSFWQRKGRETSVVEVRTNHALSFFTTTEVTLSQETMNLAHYPIMSIKISFDSFNGNKMLELLKNKFGEPVSYKTSVIQNYSGATFDKFEAFWLVDGNSIYLTNRGTKVDIGLLKAIYKTQVQDELKKEKEGAAEDKEKF